MSKEFGKMHGSESKYYDFCLQELKDKQMWGQADYIEALRNDLAKARLEFKELHDAMELICRPVMESHCGPSRLALFNDALLQPVEHEEAEPSESYDLRKVIPLTHNKTSHIVSSKGYDVTGFVLTNDAGRKCIVDMSAVRWFDDPVNFFQMMHPTNAESGHQGWNQKIRDSVDALLAEAGYAPDSSARHQLSMMNFGEVEELNEAHAFNAKYFKDLYEKATGRLAVLENEVATREKLLVAAAIVQCAKVADDNYYGPCGPYDPCYSDKKYGGDCRAETIAEEIRHLQTKDGGQMLRDICLQVAAGTYSEHPKERAHTLQQWFESIVDRVLGNKK